MSGESFFSGPPPIAGLTSDQVSALIASAAAGNLTSMQALVPDLSPVKSVNSQTGQVVVPTFQRAVGTLSSFTTSGGKAVGTWNFPFTFAAAPRCFMQVKTASTTVVFTYPVVTAVSVTSVTFWFAAQPISISIAALGSVSLLTGIPADTSVDILALNPI